MENMHPSLGGLPLLYVYYAMKYIREENGERLIFCSKVEGLVFAF